jgi:hypothetical protein
MTKPAFHQRPGWPTVSAREPDQPWSLGSPRRDTLPALAIMGKIVY